MKWLPYQKFHSTISATGWRHILLHTLSRTTEEWNIGATQALHHSDRPPTLQHPTCRMQAASGHIRHKLYDWKEINAFVNQQSKRIYLLTWKPVVYTLWHTSQCQYKKNTSNPGFYIWETFCFHGTLHTNTDSIPIAINEKSLSITSPRRNIIDKERTSGKWSEDNKWKCDSVEISLVPVNMTRRRAVS